MYSELLQAALGLRLALPATEVPNPQTPKSARGGAWGSAGRKWGPKRARQGACESAWESARPPSTLGGTSPSTPPPAGPSPSTSPSTFWSLGVRHLCSRQGQSQCKRDKDNPLEGLWGPCLLGWVVAGQPTGSTPKRQNQYINKIRRGFSQVWPRQTQTKERPVHELFPGAFRNKTFNVNRACLPKEKHKNGRNSWTFCFGPFFGSVCRGDSWFSKVVPLCQTHAPHTNRWCTCHATKRAVTHKATEVDKTQLSQQLLVGGFASIRKILVSVMFCPQFWGRKWLREFLWAPGKIRSFCKKTPCP